MGPKTTHFWGPVANWGFVAAVSFYHDHMFILLEVHLFTRLVICNTLVLIFEL